MEPTVSIIIPVHNAAPYLRQCLDSVFVQAFSDYEVICIDDASTDDSANILDEYAAAHERFTVIKGTFGGPSATRNAGLAIAQGTYIAFLDSDDWWEPNMLERVVGVAEEKAADIVIFDYWLRYETDGYIDTYRDQDMFKRLDGKVVDFHTCPELSGFVGVWDRLFRRDLLEENDIHYADGHLYEDAIYSFQTMVVAKRIAIIADHLYWYRREVSGSITFVEDGSRHHKEEFLYAHKLMQDILANAHATPESWKCYATYFLEYCLIHQRWTKPYSYFKSFFDRVREMACPTYTPIGAPAHPVLFGPDVEGNIYQRNYARLVRENKPAAAFVELWSMNVASAVKWRARMLIGKTR